jgi:RNA polymerase sigma-70 factor (ECF subfamily)
VTTQITQLLLDWGSGDKAALDEMFPIVYGELRRLATSYLRKERSDHTLQASALVNEVYIRLVNYSTVSSRNRAQFFALAAQMMRNILVDYARRYRYAKRGGGARKVALTEAGALADSQSYELIALNDALVGLNSVDSRKAQIVELRYFGGLSIEETAEALDLATTTIEREWRRARAWLQLEIAGGHKDES